MKQKSTHKFDFAMIRCFVCRLDSLNARKVPGTENKFKNSKSYTSLYSHIFTLRLFKYVNLDYASKSQSDDEYTKVFSTAVIFFSLFCTFFILRILNFDMRLKRLSEQTSSHK